MAISAPSGYVPSVQRPDIMRSILEQIVVAGDVIGTDGPCRTILAITVDNWLRQHSPGTALGLLRRPWQSGRTRKSNG